MDSIHYIIILVTLYIIYKYYSNKKKHEREEKLRIQKELEFKRIQKNKLEGLLPEAKEKLLQFKSFLTFSSGYFTSFKKEQWLSSAAEIYESISNLQVNNVGLVAHDADNIIQFLNGYKSAETYRTEYNKKFVTHELNECDSLFSNITGKSLDAQQREAIVKDEDHNLIIAGAGSGKTLTIAGKVAYLTSRLNINPSEILCIFRSN